MLASWGAEVDRPIALQATYLWIPRERVPLQGVECGVQALLFLRLDLYLRKSFWAAVLRSIRTT